MPGTMEPSSPKFCHPYEPYDIQLDFMAHLYRCLENGNVGIFESPTGTGKSLSLICGSLTWLRDHKRKPFELQERGIGHADEQDWLVQAERRQAIEDILQRRQDLERKLALTRDTGNSHESRESRATKKARTTRTASNLKNGVEDDEYMLKDYSSEDETKPIKSGHHNGISSETQALMDRLKGPKNASEDEIFEDEIKIIFCSRTHSQLSQFVNELRRVTPPQSIPPEISNRDSEADVHEVVKHLSLGSRKNLCINPRVSRLPSTMAVNEECLELQKPGTSKERKCQFLPTKESQPAIETFRNRALSRIQDIEDLGRLGQEIEICPYYASRAAIAPSEVQTLPYPLLLQKSAREALGLSIKDNIIIIDEAHNLMDAIADTCSVTLTSEELDLANSQLTFYVQKFKNRLKGKNRVYVTQVIRLLNSIADCMRLVMSKVKKPEISVTTVDLLSGKGVDQIRPHRLIQYLQESKLAQKVDGYAESKQINASSSQKKGMLMKFQSFLIVLMNPEAEGRFFVSQDGDSLAVRYALLDPREHFRDIVQDARAVILAGGTMSPMSDYADYLFSYLPPERLKTFSFGHVIPPTNLYAKAVLRGPLGAEFDFTFEKRSSETMIMELGELLVRICRVTPDGVIVFFASYQYLSEVTEVWKRKPSLRTIYTALQPFKKIFEESKDVAAEQLLREYSEAIDTGQGGLLLSVIGGKLSEGINFSDRLGRAVVAVGLPFPNVHGAEWKSKLEHVEKTRLTYLRALGHLTDKECQAQAKSASQEFYEAACMRAVNQCVGRAIRHKNDYAAILLVDRRYATSRIKSKLPLWIRNSMDAGIAIHPLNSVETDLKEFFAGKH